ARGERYMLIGFDDKTGAFVKSVDPSITKDRIEDLLSAYTEPVPSVRYDTTTWEDGMVGLIEVIREAHQVPYRVKVNIGDKLKAGDVFVRRGSHTYRLTTDEVEYLDLVAEGDRARLT
ncbi:MAG TPA: RNA-binding domain-containing protein, partial [Chloroflexia bacterium]|nr:RNA-binding domain-containing protein [Chloroflexia bacterium]